MATISFSGLGSGLDINTLTSQLVAAERAPAENRINNAAAKINSQLSALGTVKSALDNLHAAIGKLATSSDTPAFKATVQDKAGFTASAAGDVAAGRYQVEVLSLANTHKLGSAAFAKDAAVGHGTLQISAGSSSYEVAIAEGATLADIAKAINTASGGKGVTASVVNADAGQHLVLNATTAGSAGMLTVTASGGDGGLAALVYEPGGGANTLQETVAATDAQVKVDGFLRTADSNTVADLVPGLTLNLTAAKPGEAFTVNVGTDNSALKANLQSLVSMYNAANSVLRGVSAYDPETRRASALTGDSMVRGLQQQLRSALGEHSFELRAMGLTVATDGTLSLETSKLDSALATDPDSVRKLFGAEGTVGSRLATQINGAIDASTGTLTQRTGSLNRRMGDLSDQMDALNRRMEAVQTRYMAQFTAMDTLMAQMQSTSSYLTQQLSSLQSLTNNSNK
ncbi:flagellar filament capping protein FliD [Pseudoxanthomonas koreensis]|uniref:flagellar filament capping protein FliD n=1 Tax=Pseudoxanthomonas koreensis TaxID=266061 RepID=UPI0035A59A21